jgi:3-methyladenine DNA glycosylase AlkD
MNDAQLKRIKRVREKVIKNQEINDNLYQKLINELELEEYSTTEEYLFDAIFNYSEENDFEHFIQEFNKRLKS